MQSEQINELAAALVKAQAVIKPAHQDGTGKIQTKTGGSYSYDYASLNSVWDACREALHSNGLSVVQLTDDASGADVVTVVTRLLHTSGQWIEGRLSMKPTQLTPQGMGSCLTYCRRYSLMAMVGICPADDDAQEASKSPAHKPAPIQAGPGDEYKQALANANKILSLQKQYGLTDDEVRAYGEIESIKKLTELGRADELMKAFNKLQDYVRIKQQEAAQAS